MGGRGSFLKEGGFSTPARWETVGYVDGIKVLELKQKGSSRSLPERSNTPNTSYLSYRKNGDFYMLRVFGVDRVPLFEIEYGIHNGVKSLHMHTYRDGKRIENVSYPKEGDPIYEKYKSLFKGVKI